MAGHCCGRHTAELVSVGGVGGDPADVLGTLVSTGAQTPCCGVQCRLHVLMSL
jgi:hypothetical protein